MIARTLVRKLKSAAASFPVVTLTGPRQSGKTTLVRSVFPRYDYVSLEPTDQRAFAHEDPRGFLAQFDRPVILDEVQRAPDLFSYLQTLVDERKRTGQFILTGSHNFLLLEAISQTLAGRCAVLHLMPFSLAELTGRPAFPIGKLGVAVRRATPPPLVLEDALYTGFYPRIHDQRIPPREWLASYFRTYLERDVRSVLNVGDLDAFDRFVRLCAGRNGQILDLSSLASDCGITHTTARRWISVLEASFVVLLLRPHFRNFGKRMIKSPKLYFLDTGLLCYLLRIREAADLRHHSSRGAVFESFVVGEIYKNFVHRGEEPDLYYWRSSGGLEIDILIDLGRSLTAIEVKSARTVASDAFLSLDRWRTISGDTSNAALVYGGDRSYKRAGCAVYPWFAL